MLPHEPTTFAFARQEAKPFERPVRGVQAGFILDVVPYPEHDGEQLITNALVILDGIEAAAPFDPPIPIFETEIVTRFPEGAELKVRRFEPPHPRRRQSNVSDGPVHTSERAQQEEQTAAMAASTPAPVAVDPMAAMLNKQSTTQVTTEDTAAGLAAAIARSKTVKQELEKTSREKQQDQPVRKI